MKPSLLIASPQMRDPNFEKAVILLWHYDENGAIGVVVNRQLEHHLPDVLEITEVDLSPYASCAVSWGGPCEPLSGTVVARSALSGDEGWSLGHDLGVTRNEDTLRRLLGESAELMLFLGYAGWGPGQLDEEIADGGWLFTDIETWLLFDTEPQQRYDLALKSLGLSRHAMVMPPVEA